jgi:hypothetical protein
MKQINSKKPENPWQYSAIYFKKSLILFLIVLTICRVQQCVHVLGEDYLTIVSCRHNRRSFVYCCQQSFQQFSPTELLSVNDFYTLLQLICPDIPLSLIQDSAVTGCISHSSSSSHHDPHQQHTGGGGPLLLYTFEELSYSLYFRFIFTEWLIMVENLFFEGTIKTRKSSSTITLSVRRLQVKLAEWRSSLPLTTSQPSSVTLEQLYQLWGQRKRTEITFDELIQTLLQDQHFKAETIAYEPKRPAPGSGSGTQPALALDSILSGLSPSLMGAAPPSLRQSEEGVGVSLESNESTPPSCASSSAVLPGIK